MNKTSTKRLFLLTLFTLFIFHGVFGQTITVGAVDPGPYGQGSSIEVPINVNNSGGCITQTNTYNVYLSNASGSFSPGTLIGSSAGFYAGYINATIPTGTPAGAGYRVEVQSTSPAVTSNVSAAFTINTSNTGVTASVSSTLIGTDPNVFGRCTGIAGATFSIKNTSSTGTTTASFFNEGSQAGEGSNISIPTTGYTFTASQSNYTISVKNVDGSGNVATKGYQLINNIIQNNFGSAGNGFVCLTNGKGTLSYTISTTGASGISANYPGDTYTVSWGDGTSTTYTECQIAALGGVLSHTFTLPSCGQTGNGVANSFYVQNQAVSPYCSQTSSPPGISAKVLITPLTSFSAPAIACSGTALTIPNTSQPGPDPNATTSTCAANPGQLYDWTLDGVSVTGYQGVLIGVSFVFPAGTTPGNHTLTLHSELPASGIGCQAADYTQTICFEKPPVPSFTIAAEACAGTTVTPVNTSVVSNVCSVATYTWSATGPGAVTYTGGTSSTSQTPQMVFPTAGTYTVTLGVVSGCGTINTSKTIIIDGTPKVTMSAALTLCGSGQTLTFSNTATTTKTTFSGTTVQQANTYTWNVTAAAGGTYSFAGGTTKNSEYPQITFNSIDTYTVSVSNTNTCGSAFAVQKITFSLAPVVNAGPDQTVCASAPATTLAGTISGTYSSFQWTGGAGTFSPNRTTLNAVYTPSTGEIAAGSVTLTFQGNSTVPAPCNIATDNMTINITPTPLVNSAPSVATCSKQALSYGITANQPLTTFTWTASATIGTPTGFTAVGSGSSITDVITNNGNTDAVVTYNITPTLKGCPGPVFPLIVTIHPLPVMTAAPVSSPICSSLPANIALTSNVVNTTYTWTSTAAAGITGNTNQSTAKSTTSIQDILVNSNTVPASVSYTVTPYNGTCAGTPVTTSILVEPSPVIANAGPNTEICNATTYTLTGNNASPGTGVWTVVSVTGPGTPHINSPGTATTTVSGLLPGGTYQFQWTTSYYASCPSSNSIVKIVDDVPPVGGTTTGANEVCANNNAGTITLSGQSGSILYWQSYSGTGPAVNIPNTTTVLSYSNIIATTKYWAVMGNGVCDTVHSTPTTITVDQPPVVANAGPNAEICGSPSPTSYTLAGNNASPGVGTWTQTGGPTTGVVIASPHVATSGVSGLMPGNTYQFTWTIQATGLCPTNSSTVSIKVDQPPVGGVTSGAAEVCSTANNGQITLSGQFGTVMYWQSSLDKISWTQITNTGLTQPYNSLTQTTSYRAVLQNGVCDTVSSAPTTIKVDLPPVTANAGPSTEVCGVTTYTLQGNDPSPGTGLWTQVGGPTAGISIAPANKPNAVVNGMVPGNTYQFQWTTKNGGVCTPSNNTVTIVDDLPPVGGVTSGGATVCISGNSGQIILSGQSGSIVKWQYLPALPAGQPWTDMPTLNTSTIQTYLNLTVTTQFRAVISNGVCPWVYSAPSTVTVEPLPVTSNAGSDQEICGTSTSYVLQGNNASPNVGTWSVASQPGGSPVVTFTGGGVNSATATAGNLVPGVYYFTWTINGIAPCSPSTSTVKITVDQPPVGGTTAGGTTVCTGSNNGQITLSGQSGTITGWQYSPNGMAPWRDTTVTSPVLSYANLTQTTYYRAVLSNGVCPLVYSTPSTVIVMPLPVTSNPGPNAEICGSTTSYTLQGNSVALPDVGTWSVVSGPNVSRVNIAPINAANATVSNLIPGVYVFSWSISSSPQCSPSVNSVTITVDQPAQGGTTTGGTTVCTGSNGGQITLSGQTGTITGWQYYPSNKTTWIDTAVTTAVISYSNLTTTTQYRAVLKAGADCPVAYSSASTIIVAPMPIASNAGANQEICNYTSYTLNANNASPGIGTWTQIQPTGAPQPAVTFSGVNGINNPNVTVTGLIPGNVYNFTWTISTSATCPSTSSTVTITDDAPPVGGIATANPSEVCFGSNAGQITVTGQSGTIFGWETSPNGNAPWTAIGNPTTTQNFTNITATTYYRLHTLSGNTCPDAYSTVAKVTVDPVPVASNPGPNDEQCNITTYTLQGNDPGSGIGTWTQVGGPTTGIIITNAGSKNAVVQGMIPGNTYQFKWTIVSSATSTCPASSNTVNIIDDALAVGGTTIGTKEVCSGSNSGTITLSGQAGAVVHWIKLTASNGPVTVPNSTTSLSYLNLTETTTFEAVIQNGADCGQVISSTTTITVDPAPPVANAGTNDEVCSATTYTLNGNNPGIANGLWTCTIKPAGTTVSFSDATKSNATVSGLIPGNNYQFTWTITGASTACPPTSSTVTIIDDAAPVGGTTASNAIVCSGSNNGQITLSGQLGSIVSWESSTDGIHWPIVPNTSTTLSYTNLTQTTQYRAVLVTSKLCDTAYSSVTTITVNNPPPVANAGANVELCNAISYALQGNSASPGSGMWSVVAGTNTPSVNFVSATDAHTTITGLVPGTYYLKWTIGGVASCQSTSSTVVITIDAPAVGGNTASDATVCLGSNSGKITLSGQVGNVVKWQSSPDGSQWTDISNTSTIFSYTNLTQTTQYRVKVLNSGICDTATSSVTIITVVPPPPVANAGANVEICNATSYTLQGNDPGSGATGQWTFVSGPNNITGFDPSNPNAAINGLIPGIYRFTWTITGSASCPSSSSTVTIKNDAPAVGGTTASDTTVCSGSNNGQITLSGQVGNILSWQSSTDGQHWKSISNTSNTFIYNNLTTTTYYRAQILNGKVCDTAYSSTTTITVALPPPVANAGANVELCNATSYALQANNPAPATGTWTILSPNPTSASISAADIHNQNATISGLTPGVYRLQWTINGAASCLPSSSTVTITIDAPPIGGTTGGATTVCLGSNNGQVTLSGQVGNVSYWQSSTDGVQWTKILNNTSTSLSYNNLVTTTYFRAKVFNGGVCDTAISSATIITVVPPPPVANAGASAEICSQSTYTLQGNNPSPANGMWTILNNPGNTASFVGTSASTQNATVQGLTPGVYEFQWTITGSASCPPSSSTVFITVDTPPVGGMTAGATAVCSGSNNGRITLSGQVGNVSYWQSSTDGVQWTKILNNTSTSLSYNNLVTTTYFRAKVFNGGVCDTAISNATIITVNNPPPVANAGANVELCNQSTYTLQGSSPSPANGMWTILTNPGNTASFVGTSASTPNATVQGLAPGVYEFQWTITGAASCPPSSSTVTITVDAPPVGGTTAGGTAVCSGSNTGKITLSGQYGSIAGWQLSTDGGNSWTSILNTTNAQVYTFNNLTTTTWYRALIQTSLLCGQATSTPSIVTVNNPPPVANAGANVELCNQTTYTLQGNNPSPANGMWTILTNPGNTASFLTSANISNATVQGLAPGVYEFQWTITGAASCPPSSSTVTITVDAPPVGGTTTGSTAVCSGSNTGKITLSGQYGSIAGWQLSTDGGNSWTGILNTSNAQVYTFNNITTTTWYRALIQTSLLCGQATSTPSIVTVNNPPPVANAGASVEICNQSTYTLQGNNPSPANGMWTILTNPGNTASFVGGSASAINPNVTVQGLAPGVYEFQWTITGAASCPPSTSTVFITVDAPPVGGTTTGSTAVCSGSNTGKIILSGQYGSIAGWQSSTDGGQSWTNILNTTNAQVYTFNNLTATTWYRAQIQTNLLCGTAPSTPSIVTVEVPPVVANAGIDQTICNVSSYQLSGNDPGTAIGTWTLTSGQTGVTFTGVNGANTPNATAQGLTPGTYQFKWTIASATGTCPPTYSLVNITVSQPPVGGVTASDTSVCSGSNSGTIKLTGQFGTIIHWQSKAPADTVWTTIPNTTNASYSYLNLTATTQYRAILHNGICADAPSTVTTVTVNTPPPVANAGNGQEVCNVTTYTLQGNNPAPASGKWTILSGPPGASITKDTTANAVVIGMIPGNAYQFQWTITGSTSCPSSNSTVTIIDDQAPVAGTTSGTAEVCSGSNSGTITLAGQFGTILNWQSKAPADTAWTNIPNTNNTYSYVNLTQTTQYRAVIQTTLLCGPVQSTITTITVDQPPVVANAGPADKVCGAISYTLNANSAGTANGQWSVVSGPPGVAFSVSTDPHATVINLIPGNIYQFQWTISPATASSCPPTSDVVTITDDKAPIGGTTLKDTSVCSGSNTGQINLVGEYGTIAWEKNDGGGWGPTGNSTDVQGYFNLTKTTQYRAVLSTTGNCGVAYSNVTTITVDLPPVVANAGNADEVCSVDHYDLNANNAGAGVGTWTEFNGPAGVSFSNVNDPNARVSGLIPGNLYQFQWTIAVPGSSCPPTSSVVNITDDKAPIGGSTSGALEVCSGSNGGEILLSGQYGTIAKWESSTDNGNTWTGITNTNNTYHYNNLTTTTEYRAVLVTSLICDSARSTPTIIKVDMPPIQANAGANDEICSSATYNLNGNSPLPGTGVWTVESGPAGVTFSDSTSSTAIASGMIPGNTYVFKWTITGTASCPPTFSTVNIADDKAPIGGTTSGANEVCSGSNNGVITLTGQFGTVAKWEYSYDGQHWYGLSNIGVTNTYVNLTQTTQYRAVIVTSKVCDSVRSTPTIIKVDQPPIQANAGADDEVCSATSYHLNGNNPGSGTGVWTVVAPVPNNVTFADSTSATTTANNLIPGTVYQFQWTITGTASCPPTSDIVNITDDKAPIGGLTSSPNQEVCYGNNAGQIDLNGQLGTIVRWEVTTADGQIKEVVNSNNTYYFSDLTQTTTFGAYVNNGGKCGDVASTTTTITVDPPPVMSVPGPNVSICNETTYTLQGNNPAPGTGVWTVVQGTPGVTLSDSTSQNAVVSGLIPGNVYKFKWTITGSKYCPPTGAVVTITDDQAPVGGTTTGAATVCWGSNAGQITLTGQFGTIVGWESSTDGKTWTATVPIDVTTTINYSNLTRTTQYHAIMHNGTSCDTAWSTPTIITVNAPTPVSQAGADFNVCNQTIITLNGNYPGAGGGLWTQTAGPTVNILTPSNYSTQVTGLAGDTTYQFEWTIFGLAPCANSESVINVGVHTDVVPSFTMNKSNGCGPTIVAFTNTSTPTVRGTFVWNFGDGSPSITAINPPAHTFPASSDGSEKTYNISMTPTSNCGSQAPFVAQVTVSPAIPVAVLLPNQLNSCGTFSLSAQNLSPGDNVAYDFYLVDQNGAIVQHLSYPDKENAVFQPVSPSVPTTYQLYMIVTDKCGNQAKSTPINILGAPSTLTSQIQIKGDINSICLGSPITFQNISTGGDKFTITLYNADKTILTTIPATTSDLSYTPTVIGTYYVSITAGYVACGDAPVSALKEFDVYPNPEPNFVYTVDNDYNVTFINTTPDAGNVPSSALIYNWDFGDGTMNETTYAPNIHFFNFANAPFVVTLKATTPGSTCFGITTQTLDIKFHGNLFVPNAFMPAGADPALRKFYVKGQGMKTWHMQVFNNWGQLLWESTALDSSGAPTEGWDGTYKGKVCEQGVYIWQISGTLLNGEAWKGMSYGSGLPSKTGPIHLIR